LPVIIEQRGPMNDEDYLARLVRVLADEDGRVSQEESGAYAITRYRGEELEYPTTVRTTRADFHAYLDATSAQAQDLWPDAAPRRAAYNLFLVHLDEEMGVRAGNPDEITIAAARMTPSRRRAYEPPPVGEPREQEWRAAPRERP
jgi:hypothetical protein